MSGRSIVELMALLEEISHVAMRGMALQDRIEAGDRTPSTLVKAMQLDARLWDLYGLPVCDSSEARRDATDRLHREVLEALGFPEDYVHPKHGLLPAWPELEEERRP